MNPNSLLRGTSVIAGIVLILAAANASAQYEFVGQFGGPGSTPGSFNDPRGVVVRSTGQIVVSESGNDRIQVCSDTGSCTAFGTFGVETGQFDRPRGVAVNAADQIVVADRGNDRIQICTATGSCDDFGGSGVSVGQFESPRDVAVNNQGQIVVADTENNRIQICSEQGSCSAFGIFGSALGRFNSPAGVSVNPAGNIVVSDRLNNRIQTCTSQGICSAFGSTGTGTGQFNEPTGIAVDSQGRIIVVDRFNHRVQVCTDQGACSAFGGFGSGPGQFNAPWGVAVDSQDRIIVSDLGNNRIQIFAEVAAVSVDSFTASAANVQAGQAVTFSWSVSNAQSCTPTGGSDGWAQIFIDPDGGNVQLTLNTVGTHTFTLTCSGGGQMDSRSVVVTVTGVENDFLINAGLNDAWFDPQTPGQGFFITVFPDIQMMFVAWFTYDTVRPAAGAQAQLGEPGHRWLTAFGPYNGNAAALDIELTSGGVFDSAAPAPTQDLDGTLILEFTDCNSALVSYDIPSINRQGEIAIQRIALDNVPLCEQLEVNQDSATAGVNGVLGGIPVNAGLNDAWFNPQTPGQGFFITAFPDIQMMFLAWFTFDTVRPGAGVQAELGEPGHRWLTAFGPYNDNAAALDIEVTSGGIFDSAAPAPTQEPDGSIVLEFSSCNEALVSYDIASLGRQGEIPIERITLDNVSLCEGLLTQ